MDIVGHAQHSCESLSEKFAMAHAKGTLKAVGRFLNRKFLGLLIAAYCLAAIVPGLGQYMRQLTLS